MLVMETIHHESAGARDNARSPSSTRNVMTNHPITPLIRLRPAINWLIACMVSVWVCGFLCSLIATPQKWNGDKTPWLEGVFALGFFVVACYCLRSAFKEYKEALPALRADRPIDFSLPAFPKPATRQPINPPNASLLPEQLRVRLETLLQTFQAELAFVEDQVEVEPKDVVQIIRDFARLPGRSSELQAVRLRGIDSKEIKPAHRGEFPADNAAIEFEFAGKNHTMTFVM